MLAARWNHRLSTDIDLFIEEQAFRNRLDSRSWNEIGMELRELGSKREIWDLRVQPTGFQFKNEFSSISFYSVPRVTAYPISTEVIGTTGIVAEDTTEIVFKKIRGRMVNSGRYVARDLYDIVVCYGVDRRAFDGAMNSLAEEERRALRYDVQSGDAQVNDLDRVLSPRYVDLVSDLDFFNSIAGELLSDNLSESSHAFLENLSFKH